MPRTDTRTRPDRSRAMLLQPEDIVPRTAEEAIADIENAMRAFAGKEREDAQPQKPRP